MADSTELAVELGHEVDLVAGFPFAPRLVSLIARLAEPPAADGELLEDRYVELFLGSSPATCALYESAYVDRGHARGLVAVAVERAYAAAGMSLAPSAGGELPDHVAFELEFLAHLCSEEANAWRSRLPQAALGALHSQAGFLDRHLLKWFPTLVHRICLSEPPAGFYRELAEAAHAFVVHDRDLVGVLAEAHASEG